ncbi:MAG: response regulator, partial [Candidatus Brocadiae bacterium]|nr:response regulator [Candidatus Brocadiia bacterium]
MSSSPQILIADDEEDARWALCTIVRQENMHPLEACNGTEALQRILARRPDVVLLDIRMPGVDGIGVLKEVRKSDLNTPIIMITAHGSIEQAVNALKCGAYD